MDWNEIYDKELFQAPGCHTQCGGYCCNNFFGRYFNFLDKNSVALPLIDEEYEVYKKRGGVKNIKEKKYSIEVVKNKFLTFYLLSCKESGFCDPHSNRPFICKIYPYMPRVDYDSNIIGYNYASFMDIFYSDEKHHNCPLVAKEGNRIQDEITRNLPKLSPKMIFALMIFDEVIRNIRSSLPANIDLLDEKDKKIFFAKFEMLMLTGRPFKNIQTEKIYYELKKRSGEFL